jgi:glucose-6-phosphate 1-epimerase
MSAPHPQPGINGLPFIQLSNPQGDTADIYSQGAHLTSWRVQGHGEQFFLSNTAEFAPGKAIRGGVPVIFPQFGAFGPGAKHGFARNRSWEYLAARSQADCAWFSLTSDTDTLSAWPYPFAASYEVRLSPQGLLMALHIENTGNNPCQFTAALHSYFAVKAAALARIEGLETCHYWDNGDDFALRKPATGQALAIPDALDRVYFGVPGPVALREVQRQLRIESSGFADMVVWNPGQQGVLSLKDMSPEEQARMLCLESAQVAQPIILQPGERWTGSQALLVSV